MPCQSGRHALHHDHVHETVGCGDCSWKGLLALQEEEDRQRDLLEAQIQRAKAAAADEGPAEGTELQRGEDGEPLQMELGGKARVLAKDSRAAFPSAKGFGAEDEVSKCGLQPATSPALSHMNESASVLADMQPAH